MKRRESLRPMTAMLLSVCAFLFIETSCVRLPRRASLSPQNDYAAEETSAARININTASAYELEKLPGIGKALAASIVAHRERYGRFRRVEHLLLVRGISDRRFREMRTQVSVE